MNPWMKEQIRVDEKGTGYGRSCHCEFGFALLLLCVDGLETLGTFNPKTYSLRLHHRHDTMFCFTQSWAFPIWGMDIVIESSTIHHYSLQLPVNPGAHPSKKVYLIGQDPSDFLGN